MRKMKKLKAWLPVIVSDKVDGHTQVTIATRSTNSVKVGLCMFREVKVDDHIHSLNVNTSCEQICTQMTINVYKKQTHTHTQTLKDKKKNTRY
jgi:hypothetical protein